VNPKLAVVSGGVDSSTMLWTMLASGYEVKVLTFDYGQRHTIEIERACDVVREASGFFGKRISHDIVLIPHLKGSALTDVSRGVPKQDYSVETQKVTVVPNRNAIFLNIAANYAIAYGCDEIWYAAHKNDQAVYPDCTMEFVHKMNLLLYEGTYEKPKIVAPFIDNRKDEIVRIGEGIQVPFELTWSCYDPVGEYEEDQEILIHCGECGTCRERKLAFKLSGVSDPTRYAR